MKRVSGPLGCLDSAMVHRKSYAFPGTSPRKRGAFGAAGPYIDGGG